MISRSVTFLIDTDLAFTCPPYSQLFSLRQPAEGQLFFLFEIDIVNRLAISSLAWGNKVAAWRHGGGMVDTL